MAISFCAQEAQNKALKELYQEKLSNMSLEAVVKEFLSYLDYTEESDSGRVFHPITIGSCRALMSEPLDMVMQTLRRKTNVNCS